MSCIALLLPKSIEQRSFQMHLRQSSNMSNEAEKHISYFVTERLRGKKNSVSLCLVHKNSCNCTFFLKIRKIDLLGRWDYSGILLSQTWLSRISRRVELKVDSLETRDTFR